MQKLAPPDISGAILRCAGSGTAIGAGLTVLSTSSQPRRLLGMERLYGPVGVAVLDPSPRVLSMACRRAKEAGISAWLVQGGAVTLPFADRVMHSVVMTWTLCSVPDPLVALKEIRRVLKPEGKLLFVEHGLAPHRRVARWQRRLTPLWRYVSEGCHLDRKVDELIAAAGFELGALRLQYARGPRMLTYFYEGCAQPNSC